MSSDIAITPLKEKIDELNQQAWEARVSDSPKALELSQQSVQLARDLDYPKGLAEGLRSLGFAYVRLYKNEEAAPLLREALSLFQSLNDLKGQAIVYEYLGIIERNLGNLGTSLQLLLKGNSLITQIGAPEIEITTCYQIGVTYKHLGKHENALDYLYQTLSLAQKIDFKLMESYAINIIGSIYFDNGDYHRALDCYQRGFVIRHESNDKWGEAGSLDNIGFTYLKLKDLDKAIDYCKQSLAISQSTGDKKGEANALLHLAEIYEQADDVKNAAEFSNESLKIRKTRGDRRGEAEVLLFLADLHKNRVGVEDNEILDWLSKALKIAEEIKAQDLLSKAYYNLHEHYREKGDFKESLACLEAHLKIEKELHKNTINQKVSNLEISYKAETISQRNKELTELNEQIEKANAELKIESALERVRAAAMAMHDPKDMLEVCRVISEQMEGLNVKDIRNVQTAIINQEKGIYLNYEYFTQYKRTDVVEIVIKLHPAVEEFANEMLKSKDAIFFKSFEGEALDDWRAYRKRTNQDPDPMLDKATALHYYFYSIGSGALGISVFSKLNEVEVELFKRFRNVFELAYRRFVDIEKAQAQAREAQIEAALERVRAAGMAMHHSEDLISVINVVKEQLIQLGFHFHGANFVTDYSDKGYTMWLAAPNESFPTKIYVPQLQQKLFKGVSDAVEKGLDFATYTLSFEEKNLYFKNLFENSLASNTSDEGKKLIFESKGMAASVVLLNKIRLNLMNLDLVPYTDEENNILKRIAYVFEQSYIRFLDLQKAEAQAREAQIETALERIRARAMAMHSSDELIEVANILREQMGLLGQPELETSVVSLYDKQSGIIDNWNAFRQPGLTSGSIITSTSSFSKNSSELTKEMATMYDKGKSEFTLTASGSKLLEFFEVLIKSDPQVANYAGRYVPEQVFYHFTSFTGGALLTVSYQPPSEETKLLQRRAASVFDMAYRRYLDLKKAEAQARESQIEAALERVRSRSMAMHKSDELREVVAVLFAQLQHIGFDIKFCSIALIDKLNSTVEFWLSGFSQEILPESYHVPNLDHPFYQNFQNTFREGIPYKVFELAGEEKRSYDKLWFTLTDFKNLPEEVRKPMMQMDRVVLSCAFTKNGMIQIGGFEPLSDTDASIVQRFAKVFEQTHTRFLDLQKAEAQAREAQIEAGLERVRSKTMAMHKSEEVTGVSVSLCEELLKLGFEGGSTIIIMNKDNGDTEQWTGFSEDKSLKMCYVPYFKHPCHDAQLNAWKKGEKVLVYTIAGDEKRSLDEHYFATGYKDFPESDKAWMRQMESVTFSHAFMKYGAIHWGPGHLTEEQIRILQRFSKVFEQSYTRFLDLQKAEAQAREAQMEAALEKVRSRSLAMHKSEELNEVIHSVFERLTDLNFELDTAIIIIFKEDSNDTVWWLENRKDQQHLGVAVKYTDISYFRNLFEARRNGKELISNFYSLEEKNNLLNYLFEHTDFRHTPEQQKEFLLRQECATMSVAIAKNTGIHITRYAQKSFSESQNDILKKFSKVFDQAYTRFLDLQKAEEQAREAQIEAALERVRAKVMAMSNSKDLNDTSLVFGEQLRKLGIDWQFSYFWLIVESKNENTFWITWPDYKTSLTRYTLAEAEEYFNDCLISWRAGVKIHDNYVPPEAVQEWLDTFQRIADDAGGEAKKIMVFTNFKHGVYYYDAMMKYGSFGICINKPATDEEKKIQCRFAIEFERAYTRFLDLKHAEAQAREAQIEASLERVRGRAMAMHKSEDLHTAVATVFEELERLDLGLIRCGIAILDKEKPRGDSWITIKSEKGNTIQLSGDEPLDTHPLLQGAYDAWLKQEDFYYELKGDDLPGYYRAITKTNFQQPITTSFSSGENDQRQYYANTVFQHGSLFAFLDTPFTDEAKSVMKRFANVFNLTYKRFLDLQKAEAQTREALIEAALERVRARALAMQQPEELKDVAQVLRNEMGALGVEELETSSIYIHGEDSEHTECWYALQDPKATEKKMVADHFILDLNETWVGREMKKFFGSDDKQISIIMQGDHRKEWIEYCYRHSPVFSGFYGEAIPDRTYHLYKFSHGYIGAAAPGEISAESWKLLGRAASVFSLAYSRFKDLTQARNDLIKLKEEKKRAEEALSELQATQKQLIQSEKMASLGELTAGIAHEIQNPLNFVNNFSDVSNELLDEMEGELATGNMQSAKEIVKDVKDNLEKILHHGKRADAIVKSMLQHSRSSSSKKEPTDINALAEEYLRLAFHGLRAKDKSFNAKFETHLDTTIEKINIVPQEVGRVILNLINNAFYAVNEKKKTAGNGYEPIVTVSTKYIKPRKDDVGVVEIKVKDNGNGIPQKVLDKIFQPFFTTKPTGQGTGLGLSLSYDIVTKGHGGDIKVETKEGEGSEFIISLPMNN